MYGCPAKAANDHNAPGQPLGKLLSSLSGMHSLADIEVAVLVDIQIDSKGELSRHSIPM